MVGERDGIFCVGALVEILVGDWAGIRVGVSARTVAGGGKWRWEVVGDRWGVHRWLVVEGVFVSIEWKGEPQW